MTFTFRYLSVLFCIILFPLYLFGEDCTGGEIDKILKREKLSDRSFAACSKKDEAEEFLPALRVRLETTLNDPVNERNLTDVRFLAPAILRLGQAEDIEYITRLYRGSAPDSRLSPLFAEAFLELKLLKAATSLTLSKKEIFPPDEMKSVEESARIMRLPDELRDGYRMYQLIHRAEKKARACSLTSEDTKSFTREVFWPKLFEYLTQEKNEQVNIPGWLCTCASKSELSSQIILGLKLLRLYERGEYSAFLRGYAIGWRNNDFRYRSLCAYSDLEYFNAGVDPLFQKAGIDRELIYMGALISQNSALDYSPLKRFGGKNTTSRLKTLLQFFEGRKGEQLVKSVLEAQ
jgi:hypothetical protein